MMFNISLITFFLAVAVDADLNRVQVSPILDNTPEAKHFIKEVKEHVLAQPPRADRRLAMEGRRLDTNDPSKLFATATSRRLNQGMGYHCYWTMQKFNITLDNIEVEIVANENEAVVGGSSGTRMDIKTTTAVIDTASTGWKVGGQKVEEWTGSVGLEFPHFKPSASYKYSNTASDEASEGTDKKNEIREEVKQRRTCPPNTACSVQTWTFTARIRGNCPVVPIVDPRCFADARVQRDIAANKPVFDLLRQNDWMHDNISIPAVNGQLESWDILATHFYNMTKNGFPAGKVQPAHEVDGIFIPSDEYNINYKDNPRCELKSPVFRTDGSAQRVHVMIEKRINSSDTVSLKSRARGSDEGVSQSDVKVTILRGLIW